MKNPFLTAALISLAIPGISFAGEVSGTPCVDEVEAPIGYNYPDDYADETCEVLTQSNNVSVTTSVRAITSGLRSASEARRNAPVATQDNLTFSTQGGASGVFGWASLHGRTFSGDISGDHAELTLGADIGVGPTSYVGVLLSTGRTDMEHDASSVDADVDTLSFGIYGAYGFGDAYEISGYLLGANPRYDVGGTDYTAQRRAFGVTAAAAYALGSTDVISTLSLSEIREIHPSAAVFPKRTYKKQTASIGIRANFNAGEAFRPYASFAIDHSVYREAGNDDIVTAPHLGLGFDYDLANGSTLSVKFDGGRVENDITDAGLELNYLMQF